MDLCVIPQVWLGWVRVFVGFRFRQGWGWVGPVCTPVEFGLRLGGAPPKPRPERSESPPQPLLLIQL